MEKYRDLMNRQQKEVNEFPCFFAFDYEQFAEGMRSLGLAPSETYKIYEIGFGGFIRKTDHKAFHEMLDRHSQELKDAMKDADFAYDAFRTELADHEFCITHDYTDTLDALELTGNQVRSSSMLSDALSKATHDYLDAFDKWQRGEKNEEC